MKRIVLIVSILGLALIGLNGCWRSVTPERKAEFITSKIKSELDLNSEQNAKLQDLKNAMLEAIKNQSQNKGVLKTDIKNLILSSQLEESAVKATIQKKRDSMETVFAAVYPKLAAFHDSLTPEQKKKAAECFEKFSDRWDNH